MLQACTIPSSALNPFPYPCHQSGRQWGSNTCRLALKRVSFNFVDNRSLCKGSLHSLVKESCKKSHARRVNLKRTKSMVIHADAGDSSVAGQSDPQSISMQQDRPGSKRIVLFVEPSPFSYVCGYKNRFQNFIKYLREMGDEVLIVTTHEGAPSDFFGAKIVASWSFPCPLYTVLPLSLALSPRIFLEVAKFKPDIIHASSPGVMVFGALAIAKILSVPMVMSYHTHVPIYLPKYSFSWLVKPMWLLIKFLHRAADLTLVTSSVIGKELNAAGAAAADRIRLWRKGVDSENFHPRFQSSEMRTRLTNGQPEKPLIIHVGRLGVEKNLEFLRRVLENLPDVRLAFIGDGPMRKSLEDMFAGMPVVFTGMLEGEELSQAYASGDVFITPSETETLGFVVLEAMASGVPVVAARAGGIPDIINQEGETAFMYTPGDLEDCLNKIRDLISSPKLREKIGMAGRHEVEKFDWRASTKQVRDEEYNAAITFWKRRRHQVRRRLAWFVRWLKHKAAKSELKTT